MGTNNKGITYLSYLGILALIPFMSKKDDEFVQFHAKQGLNLFIFEVIVNIILNVLGLGVTFISGIIYLLFSILSIIGLVNVAKGLKTPLPVIGSIQIIK